MKSIPLNDTTATLARRLIWFESPAQALTDPVRFMAYAFARATHEQMNELRRWLSDDDLRDALTHAPPGIIDARSWAYWHHTLGQWPSPPLPKRFASI